MAVYSSSFLTQRSIKKVYSLKYIKKNTHLLMIVFTPHFKHWSPL